MRDRKVLQIVFGLTQEAISLERHGIFGKAEGIRLAIKVISDEYSADAEDKKKNKSEREARNFKNLHRSVSRAAAAEIREQKNGN